MLKLWLVYFETHDSSSVSVSWKLDVILFGLTDYLFFLFFPMAGIRNDRIFYYQGTCVCICYTNSLIIFCMMMGFCCNFQDPRNLFIFSSICWHGRMVFGYAFPAYECYKAVEKNRPEIEQLRFWCQYW